MSALRKILLPIDGSEHSKRAFSWYLQNVRQPNDEVVLVHACEVPTVAGAPYPFGAVTLYEDWQKHWSENNKKAQVVLDDYAEQCKANNLPCKTVKQPGNPGEFICEKAKEENASCIIMGSRGLGTIRRTLLGSVSNYVLNHAHTSVSIVPPEEH